MPIEDLDEAFREKSKHELEQAEREGLLPLQENPEERESMVHLILSAVVCIGYTLLTSSVSVSLGLSRSHQSYHALDQQAFIATYLVMANGITIVVFFVLFLIMAYRGSRQSGDGFGKVASNMLIAKTDLLPVVVSSFMLFGSDNSKLTAVALIGAMNVSVLSSIQVLVTAILEIEILHATYTEIHVASFIGIIGLSASYVLASDSHASQPINVTGCLFVATYVILTSSAGVLDTKYLRAVKDKWLFRCVVAYSNVLCLNLLQLALLLHSSHSQLTLGKIIYKMDVWAVVTVILITMLSVTAVLVLKLLSPLAKCIAKAFKPMATALLVWCLSGRPLSHLDCSLLLVLSSTAFISARTHHLTQHCYKMGRDDSVEVLYKPP